MWMKQVQNGQRLLPEMLQANVKNAQLCFGQEAQAVMQESEEQDKELVAGYTLEEAEEKEAREEAERIAAEEAARKAEEEAAKKKQALSSVGTTYDSSVDAPTRKCGFWHAS